MVLSHLEKAAMVAAASVPATAYLSFENTAPHTAASRVLDSEPLIRSDVTPYLGNFPESFAVPASAGLIGDYLEYVGALRNNQGLQMVGKYLPELSAGMVAAYFTLGETILPSILPGSPDIRDIPAVLVSALAGYVVAKLSRKANMGERLAELVRAERQRP